MFFHPLDITSGFQSEDRANPAVQQARGKSFIGLFNSFGRRDDCGHTRQIAVVNNLEEFFLRPGCSAGHTQIIEHQKRYIDDLVKSFVESRIRTWIEAHAQIVQADRERS